MNKVINTIKDLALPIAMVIGTICYLIGRYTPALDDFGNWLEPIANESLPVFLFLVLYVTFGFGFNPDIVAAALGGQSRRNEISFKKISRVLFLPAERRDRYELLQKVCHIISVPESVPRFSALVITTLLTPASMAAKALSSLGIIPPLITSLSSSSL